MATQVSVEELRNKMARAADLEAQLENLPKKSSEERSSTIRMQLCEILSDVMLADPYFAMRKDCAGRLWRHCFYGRTNQLRGRIAREKRKKGPAVKKLETNLNVFLKEAITLYQWIVNKYESKLLPQLPDSQLSQESSASIITPPDNVAGVIPGLHRLLIHLGDLNRYIGSYRDAEKSYTEAAKLAPGRGNPYNQLAVVAQQKTEPVSGAPLSCIALYWYSRSLLAVNDPFDTSKANLERMFDSNRDWLANHGDDEPIIPPAAPSGNKKTMLEQARAQKSAASQRFLARFVDVHHDFYWVANNKTVDEPKLVEKVKDVTDRFTSLIDATAFGDSLLCKMVTINAFSIHGLRGGNNNCFELAMVLLLRFGASLSQRVEKTLQKLVPATKQQSPVTMPSVRLVVPLVLICDYLSTFPDDQLRLESSQDHFVLDAVRAFWSSVAAVANHLDVVRDQLDARSIQYLRMKEYDNLMGYRPFQPFLRQAKGKKEEVYVSVEEAVKSLELSPSSTQESVASVSSGNEEENRLKLVRFLQVVDRFVRRWETKDSGLLVRDSDGAYSFAGPETRGEESNEENDQMVDFENLSDSKMETSPVTETSTSVKVPLAEGNHQEDDDPGDVVVYKPSAGGTGPALLVPGPLLTKRAKAPAVDIQPASMETAKETEPADQRKDASSGVDLSSLLQATAPPMESHVPIQAANQESGPSVTYPMDVAVDSPATKPLPPPPGLAPPPGFGATASAPPVDASGAPKTVAAPAPPPGFSLTADSPPQNVHMQGLDLTSLRTANPFVAEYPQPSLESLCLFGTTSYGQPKSSSDFLDVNRDYKEDTSLLDTAFLTNLWLEESQQNKPPLSKNPFLT